MRIHVGVVGVCACVLAHGGCTARIDGGAAGPATVAFTAPAPGASFTRGALSAATGALVADVPVAVATTGDVARVAIARGDHALGDVDASGMLDAQLDAPGPATLTATAY